MAQNVQISNWNITNTYIAHTLVKASCYQDVCNVVSSPAQYPTPVLAVGSLHSVTACVTNPGTVVDVSALNKVLGLTENGVRVQAGVKLADLHDWLAQHDLEISFSPEIGDATVGSLVVCTSKDSSIDGPGYLSGLVTEVKYADENGHIVSLSRAKTQEHLLAFTCSYGMMGIVLEAVLEVRPRIAITTWSYCPRVKNGAKAAAKLLKQYKKCDAVFAILVPDRQYVYVETRKKAAKYAVPFARSELLGYLGTVGENPIAREIMIKLKYDCFLKGNPPGRKTARVFATNKFPVTHFRRAFVNRYPEVQPGSRRLDFSFVEFDMSNFQEVLEGCWDFHAAFKTQHGYAPRGYGIYFVNRGWGKDVDGYPRKPTGNFSGPPGISFMLDPITDDCENPKWLEFNTAYTAWAIKHGAVPSLSQTKGLMPGQLVLPRKLTRERFLTPFYAQFVA